MSSIDLAVLGPKQNFLALDPVHSALYNSQIVVLPVPYEQTTSYGTGTRRGPKAILKSSHFVEFYDDEFDRELCFDIGLASLKPPSLKKRVDQGALDLIGETVGRLLDANKFVVTLGGEHTISTAPILEHLARRPNASILHLDAHSDLRDSYEGSKYSHACFATRVLETVDPSRLTQVGIRALCREEADYIRANDISTFYANAIRRGEYGEPWQKEVVRTLADEVYLTFDVDYFDPAIMPSTGTPEPDGFLYSETLDLFREMRSAGKRIIGFDVVELSPIERLHHANILAARLVYKLLNFAFADTPPSPKK